MNNKTEDYELELHTAIWAGDMDRLQQLAPCGCCCDEHFFDGCEARVWGGCRGQGSMTRSEKAIEGEKWFQHYAKSHGMTREQFFGE